MSSDNHWVKWAVKTLFVIAVFMGMGQKALLANNLVISNVAFVSQDTTKRTIIVEFDISWDNSWRSGGSTDMSNGKTADSLDAVWVVLKWQRTGSNGDWWPGILYQSGVASSSLGAPLNSYGYTVGTANTPMEIVVPSYRYGFFVRRASSDASTTTNTVTGMRVVWDYSLALLQYTDTTITSCPIKLFGVEMAYVPEGQFAIGDGGFGSGQFHWRDSGGSLGFGWVTSEDMMTFTINTNNTWYYEKPGGGGGTGENNSGDYFTVPAAYPKGYNGFYVMKYEITEGQYVSFLNSLNRSSQNNLVASNVSGDAPTGGTIYVMSSTTASCYRNTIVCPASGNGTGTASRIVFSTTREDRACNFLSWPDICALADWMALRPLSEMEFEKACRGNAIPVYDEYAWGGNASTVYAGSTISGSEDGTETISTTNANVNYLNSTFTNGDAGQGPLRAGIFATASSTRTSAGAGYYGALDLSGSLWERAACIGTASGRNVYRGTHGDGLGDTSNTSIGGLATPGDWPGYSTANKVVTGAEGSGFRGGSWVSPLGAGRVSDRHDASGVDATRKKDYGGRLCRTNTGYAG